MNQSNKINYKSYVALFVFCSFWLFTSLYILFPKFISKKVSGMGWVYSQTFSQSWNFFTQPALYNDRLFFVFRNNDKKMTDSIDVLQTLWNNKRSKFNYAYENVWDHIMWRNIRKLREKIQDSSMVAYSDSNIFQQIKYYELAEKADNKKLLFNVETFGFDMLQHKNIDSNNEYQLVLYTDYIKPFSNEKYLSNKQLVFQTNWLHNTHARH